MNDITSKIIAWSIIMIATLTTIGGALAAPPQKAIVDVWWYDNTTNHYEFNYNKVDRLVSFDPPQAIIKARISVPYDTTGNVITKPDIMIRELGQVAFNKTISYCDDTEALCFNNPIISKDDQTLTFWVEHFTDYLVGAGQDYENLTDCLNANNNTENTCVINAEGVHTIQGANEYILNHTAIDINVGNVTLDCNYTLITGRQISGKRGININRVASNITVKNCRTKNWYDGGVWWDSFGYTDSKLFNHTDTNSTRAIVFNNGDINATNLLLINNHNIGLSVVNNYPYINGVNISNFLGDVGQPAALYVNLNGENGTLNNITVTEDPAATSYACAWLISNTGSYFYLENSSFTCPSAQYGMIVDNARNIIISNNNVTSGEGIGLFVSQSTRDSIFANNSFTNQGNGHIEHQFYASYPPINYSGNIYNYLVRIYSATAASFDELSAPETQANIPDGTNDFHLFLCGGAVHATIYVENTTGFSCAALCAAGGLVCDYSENNVFTSNGNANYTWNGAANVSSGNADPPYIRYELYEFQDNATLYAQDSYNINFTGNIFTQTAGTYNFASVTLTETTYSLLFWNNHFRSAGVDDWNGTNSACNNGTGNFYLNGLTPFIDDCGQSNITSPANEEDHASSQNTYHFIWTQQDARLSINYSLYYSFDNNTWEYITTTNETFYVWNYSDMQNPNASQDTYMRLVPDDGVVNGTNVYRSFNIFKNPIDTGLNGSSVALTIFSLVCSLGAVGLANIKRYVKDDIANMAVRRGFLVVGVTLMALTSAIVMTIVGQSTIPLTREVFTYMWLFGWTAYALSAYLVLKTLFDALSMWNIKKHNKRMGDDGE